MSVSPQRQTYADGPITRESCTPTKILQMWQRTSARFAQSRARGLACHNLRHNLDASTIPDTWGTKEDREQIAAMLPERQLIEQGIVNSLSEYWPVYRRQAIGSPSPTKRRHAGDLERWLEGCDAEQMDHEAVWLKAAEDGEFAYLVIPDLADYHRAPSFSDEISDAEYRALDERGRVGWRYDGARERWKRPRSTYWRDGFNRPTADAGTRSEKATRAAYTQAINTLGKRLPWVERLVSMYDCAPILTRGRGKARHECTGLIVRTLYDVDELQSDGWRWIDMGQGGLVPRGFSRSENGRGHGQSVYLYEYYGYDHEEGKDGTMTPVPFVAYTVAGVGTSARWGPADAPHKEQCAVVDLRAAFGLDRLHVGYFWGLRTGADDPDYIGRPLLWPLVATIANLEKIVTAKNAFDWDTGFNGFIMPLDPKLDPEVQRALVANGEFKPFVRPEPGEVVTSAGPVLPFVGAEASRGISENIAFHSDRLQRNKPQDDVAQRASGATGRSMLVADDLEQQAHRQLRECVRQVHKFAGQARIEIGCAFDRKFGIRVPVEANLEHAADSAESVRGLIEFDERWVGEVYKITSEFPKVGNLAESQQYADFHERGLVLWEEFREKLGDEDPANSRVKRDVEAYYASPPAMLRLDAAVAAMLNDQEEKDRLDAELAGLLTPEGVPQSAIAPDAMAGAAMPGQLAGLGLPNVAGAALGGQVNAELQAGPAVADATMQAGIPGGV